MTGYLIRKQKHRRDKKELHDIYGYSKKELAKMSDHGLEILLFDEMEEDEECFF